MQSDVPGHSSGALPGPGRSLSAALAALVRLPAGSWALVLLGAVVLTRLAALFCPFFATDEATYSALASRILEGAAPYVGAVDHKPVGIEMTYALVYAAVGRNHILFVRLLFFAFLVANGLVLSRIGERLRGDPSGRLAGLVYVIASAWGLPGDVAAANTELFLNLPLSLAALLILPPAPGGRPLPWRNFLLAGVLTGIAMLFKYQAALAGGAWALTTWLSEGGVRARIGRLALLLAGFCALTAGYLAYFAFSGTWDGFLFWGLEFNKSYVEALPIGLLLWNATYYTLIVAGFWMPLLLCLRIPSGRAARFVLPWAGSMLLSATVGGRFFPHYYLMALPPVCLLLFVRPIPVAAWRRNLAVVLGVGLTVASLALAFTWDQVKPHLLVHREAFREIGAFVDGRSGRDDRIFVWGNSPEIYYESDRVMGTRFPFCNYHTGKIWGTTADDVDATDTEQYIVPRAWTELLADLDADPPRLIVDAAAGRLDRFDLHPISRYPELARRVAQRYRLVGTPAGVPVYELLP